ncbi:hypothetical protein Taro_037522 [Colocasia esculenta]|uniref:Uncharacterized protein n=1 Tax=Colocasia esculenta TaxID=4460 RepID=A0A843WPZ2_COLES|nr:hypothetical protein [Colocasia esculenta]
MESHMADELVVPLKFPGDSVHFLSHLVLGQTFSCKGSVDITINGVDTMAQSKGRKVKKISTSVDTSPGQVDTRDRSPRNMLTGFHLSGLFVSRQAQ